MIEQSDLPQNSSLTFKLSDSTHTYNCVVNALKMAGFKLTTTSGWNLKWTGQVKVQNVKSTVKSQKLNHFPGCWSIGRKDNMWRNISKFKRSHGEAFNIAPKTYIFPEDFKRWNNDRDLEGYKHLYILKPVASSCGRGIKVIGKKQVINKKPGYLASKYVSKPHLLRGHKYDLRLYVLVTSFEPLRVYLF